MMAVAEKCNNWAGEGYAVTYKDMQSWVRDVLREARLLTEDAANEGAG